MEYVRRVSENMQLFAPEDVLTGRDFLCEYDPEVCINDNKGLLLQFNLDEQNISISNDSGNWYENMSFISVSLSNW